MRRGSGRWLLVPAILFLSAGLISGGADLSRGWTLILLGVPLVFLLGQLLRPTDLGWRLALGSFCLLIVTTAIVDLTAAVPQRIPGLSASAAMVALFVLQFGVPAWLIWLAKPPDSHPAGHTRTLKSRRVGEGDAEQQFRETNGQPKLPPNHGAQRTGSALSLHTGHTLGSHTA